MTRESAHYLGSFLFDVINSVDGTITIQRDPKNTPGFYILDELVPVHLKYTTKRHSPWFFTFTRDHQLRQQHYYDILGKCIVVFVCGRDGIIALSFEEFRHLLDQNFEPQESVSIRRKHKEMYQINGRDGELTRKVGRNSLAKMLQNHLEE